MCQSFFVFFVQASLLSALPFPHTMSPVSLLTATDMFCHRYCLYCILYPSLSQTQLDPPDLSGPAPLT